MQSATITTLTFAAAGAPFWIVGWIIFLVLVIGLAVLFSRRRRRAHRPPQ
jgi:uncharacterized RDD family membrane protein YckC